MFEAPIQTETKKKKGNPHSMFHARCALQFVPPLLYTITASTRHQDNPFGDAQEGHALKLASLPRPVSVRANPAFVHRLGFNGSQRICGGVIFFYSVVCRTVICQLFVSCVLRLSVRFRGTSKEERSTLVQWWWRGGGSASI